MRFGFSRMPRMMLSLTLAAALMAPSASMAQIDAQSILNSIKNGQQVQQQTGVQNTVTPLQPTVSSATQTLSPQTAPMAPQGQSRLEFLYSQRAGRPLSQFGYDQFGVGQSVSATQIGAVQDNYILGAGDQLIVTLRGHENATYQVPIDRDGQVVIPNIEPVSAGGRRFGEVRDELSSRIAAAMIGTKAFISVANVRQISVVVAGEVQSPGVRTLSGLNTALDAILLSGGIKKTGSLRSVTVIRGARRFTVDLYSMIARGRSGSTGALTDGDRVYVPPIQSTVAVAGFVKRPGIYELASGATAIDARSLMTLAGGIEIAGAKRLSKLEIQSDGRGHIVALPGNGIIRSGEVLFVDPERSVTLGRVTLDGAVNTPGIRALGGAATMNQILRDPDDLTPDAYTLFSAIIHRDRASNFRVARAFSAKQVFDGSENPRLDSDDHVYIFTSDEVQMLAAAATRELSNQSQLSNPALNSAGTPTSSIQSSQIQGQAPAASPQPVGPSAQPGSMSLSDQAAALSVPGATQPAPATTASDQFNAGNSSTTTPARSPDALGQGPIDDSIAKPSANSIQELAQRLQIDPTALVRFARDYLVWVNGEVRAQGPYLADTGTNLKDLIAAAGGFQLQADLSSVEVTTTQISATTGTSATIRRTFQSANDGFAGVKLSALDSVRVRPVFSNGDSGQVTITGQVKFPGTFDITRGEHLSSVLLRAGGLTNEGYPYGAVFTRVSAAQAEVAGNQRVAQALEDQLASVAADPQTTVTQVTYLATLAQNMRKAPAVGRITVTSDPVVLATHPELDMLMEPGDTIYIPKRPSTVAVSGEVLNTGAFQYREGRSAEDYLELAGGENRDADDGAVFVLLPDGTAKPHHAGWWSFSGADKIPPGSTIIVPRDPRPFVLSQFLATAVDIVSKLALTAASLAVVTRQ
jgi:polysaccharide export outer membrane protein